MNIIERYVKNSYKIDNKYRFVRIVEKRPDTWYNNYYGMVFVVIYAYASRSNKGALRFPYDREKLQIPGNRVPLIAISSPDATSPHAGELLEGLEIHERPVNWDEYIKEIERERILRGTS